MFENTGRNRSVVGGAAGLTLVLALGVATGIVPHASDRTPPAPQLTAASAAPTVPVAAPEAPPATGAPAPVVEAPPAPAPKVRSSTAVSSASEQSDPSTEADAAPAPEAVAAAAGVARVTPSSAQVQAAIQGFHQRIPLFSPTAAQVAQFGDQVCSAFDQ
nr:hypothetical protein [Actinomycetota bacterium]